MIGLISLMYAAQAVLELLNPEMNWGTASDRLGWTIALLAFAVVAVTGFTDRYWAFATAYLLVASVVFPLLMANHVAHTTGYLNTPAALGILIYTMAALRYRLRGQLIGIGIGSLILVWASWVTGSMDRILEMTVGTLGQAGFLLLLVSGLRAGAERADRAQSRGWIATSEAAHQAGRAGAADVANRLIHDSVLATLTVISEARSPQQQQLAIRAAGQTVVDIEDSQRSVEA